MNITAAPKNPPMWDDEPVRRSLASAIQGLSFHPDDVEAFTAIDVIDLLQDILIIEFGWHEQDRQTLAWGDSSVQTHWTIYVSAFESIKITELEGGHRVASTTFEGDFRAITPRALAFLAQNQAA
jgi:hypothetical protein